MNKKAEHKIESEGPAPGYSLASSNDLQVYSSVASPGDTVSEQSKSKLYWLLLAVLSLIGAGFVIIFLTKNNSTKPPIPPSPPLNPQVFHLIPHSHDDLGWLITERDYSDSIVSHIIRTSSRYLLDNPANKFSFCNIGFLRHWTDSNPNNVQLFKQALATGRMEVLNGGYSVHDNAAVYFDDIVSTYEYSREFLWQQFGYIPRTGWLIDPFGLSLTTSRLYAEMGYQELVTNRIPEWEREQMRENGQLQKYWTVRNKSEYTLLMSEMADHYQTTSPLNVDFGLGEPENSFPQLSILSANFSLSDNMTSYLDGIVGYEGWFPTRNIMIPFGGDFYFRNFNSTIQIVDAALIYVTSNSWTGRFANNISFVVSSANQYFDAVAKDALQNGTIFTNKTRDFFPYENNPNVSDPSHQSWTGYFVTNPYAKRLFRSFSQATRGLKNLLGLYVLRTNGVADDISVEEIASNTEHSHWLLGINTHHDTITGTSREMAADSYVTIADDQFSSLNTTYNLFLTKFVNMSAAQASLYCQLQSPYRQGLQINQQAFYLFISQGGQSQKLVRFFSPFVSLELKNTLTNDSLLPVSSHRSPNGTWEHAVLMNLNPAQAAIYQINEDLVDQTTTVAMTDQQQYTATVSGISVQFSVNKGLLTFSDGSNTFTVQLKRYIWNPLSQTSNANQGKYLFTSSDPPVAVEPDAAAISYTLQKKGTSIDINMQYLGKLIFLSFKYLPTAPLHQRFSVRVDMDILDALRAGLNVNFVVSYTSQIANGKVFTTDSNGLESIQRTFGQVSNTVDLNYYPLTSYISIQDSKNRMTVMVDRAQGGTSPNSGEIEVMINRRTHTDDGKGAGEGAFEKKPVSVLHYIVLEPVANDGQLYRQHQVEADNPLIVYTVSVANQDTPVVSSYAQSGVPGLPNAPLVRVLFDRRSNGRLMLRVYNMDDLQSYALDMQTLLAAYGITNYSSIIETGIDFNFSLEEMNSWNYRWLKRQYSPWTSGQVSFEPLQIRTFEIKP